MKKDNFSKKYILIPLLDMGENKLCYNHLKRALLDEQGKGTLIFDYFNLFSWNCQFEERNGYQLHAEINIIDNFDYRFCVGESGLFLKARDNKSYLEIEDIKSNFKEFINFCKMFLFKPLGIAHWSDGDSFIYSDSYYWLCIRSKVKITMYEVKK